MEIVGALKRLGVISALTGLAVASLQAPPALAVSVPSEPRSVQACAATGEATVSWRAPRTAGGDAVDGYKVVRWASGVPKVAVKVGPKRRSLLVRNLLAGTTYSFKVQAHNTQGWSPASKTAQARPPVSGFGTVAGTCGVVASQLSKPTPSLFEDRLDFGDDPFDIPTDVPLLTSGGQYIYNSPNAGGSSTNSEIFAYETLARSAGASLVKTETEIIYDELGKITDMSVAIAGNKVGVSVTRAVDPPGNTFTQDQAFTILSGKLNDVQESSANVSDADAWVKQILVVMAATDANAATVKGAWSTIDDITKGDTILYIVVTDGADTNLYFSM